MTINGEMLDAMSQRDVEQLTYDMLLNGFFEFIKGSPEYSKARTDLAKLLAFIKTSRPTSGMLGHEVNNFIKTYATQGTQNLEKILKKEGKSMISAFVRGTAVYDPEIYDQADRYFRRFEGKPLESVEAIIDLAFSNSLPPEKREQMKIYEVNARRVVEEAAQQQAAKTRQAKQAHSLMPPNEYWPTREDIMAEIRRRAQVHLDALNAYAKRYPDNISVPLMFSEENAPAGTKNLRRMFHVAERYLAIKHILD